VKETAGFFPRVRFAGGDRGVVSGAGAVFVGRESPQLRSGHRDIGGAGAVARAAGGARPRQDPAGCGPGRGTRAELDGLEEQLVKQLDQVRAEWDEFAVAERVLARMSKQVAGDRAASAPMTESDGTNEAPWESDSLSAATHRS
jgi:hypothetical protein